MDSLIVYYSYSGNTREVAAALKEILSQKGKVELIELAALDEPKSFLAQCRRAFLRRQAKIRMEKFDLNNYDLICFGTPVWAFAPAPAMNTYLERCFNIINKPAVLFATFGSGAGIKKCFDYMEKVLAKKGVKQFSRFSIQQAKVSDKDFVKKIIFENLNT